MMKKIIYVLTMPRETALATLIYKTCPMKMDIVIVNFHYRSEFDLGSKIKYIQPHFFEDQVESIKENIPDLKICNSAHDFKKLLSEYDICISGGRELYIFKPLQNLKYIALSACRIYFQRLLQVLPEYNDKLKIFLDNKIWLDKKVCGDYGMSGVGFAADYDYVQKNIDCFEFNSPLAHYVNVLQHTGKEKIKQELRIPMDKKVALFSFRRADETCSLHGNDLEFYNTCMSGLQKLKDLDYYIICRRRLGRHDFVRRSKSVELGAYADFEHLIDLEMSGFGSYPEEIWKAMYCSDLLFLPDNSSIASIEAAICKIPVYMPIKDFKQKNDKMFSFCPSFRDMCRKDLLFEKLTENNIEYFNKNVDNFVISWYYNDIEGFWKMAL